MPNDDFSLLLTLAPEHPLSDVGLDSNLIYTMSSEALPAIFRLSCKVQECKSLPNSDAYHIHVVIVHCLMLLCQTRGALSDLKVESHVTLLPHRRTTSRRKMDRHTQSFGWVLVSLFASADK